MSAAVSDAQSAGLVELCRAAGVEMAPEMLSVVVELLHHDVTPQGVVALLRSLKDAKLRAAAGAVAPLPAGTGGGGCGRPIPER